MKVLAHFAPGDKVLQFLEPQSDWLDIRYCGEDDDETFYRELPDAQVIWHVLRPISGDDLHKAWQALAEIGVHGDGQTHIADVIRRLKVVQRA